MSVTVVVWFPAMAALVSWEAQGSEWVAGELNRTSAAVSVLLACG